MWAGREASNRIIGYYSLLFSFPSRKIMVAAIAVVPMVVCALSFTLIWGFKTAILGLFYGFLGVTAAIFASDILVSTLFSSDPFMSTRRIIILSYSSFIVFIMAILTSFGAAYFTGKIELVHRGIAFAVAIVASLRYLTISVFSTQNIYKNIVATILEPALILTASSILVPFFDTMIVFRGALGSVVLILGVQVLLWVMGRWRSGGHEMRLLPLFRAFFMSWAEEINEPLEEQITRVGERKDLSVDSLRFFDDSGCRFVLLVPYIHPGPFRNVGSSALPQVLEEQMRRQLGCRVAVVHGISTHQEDLASSKEMLTVAEHIKSTTEKGETAFAASPMMLVNESGAKVSCQMFGKVALITLSMSPKSHDDLPEALGERITKAAEDIGVNAVIVDSHNSILQSDELDENDVENLYRAAVEAMEKARESPHSRFRVGFARVVPTEWGLDEGMGPLGVTAIVVSVESGETSIYLVVDGNNMKSGLSEKITYFLKSRGFNEAEVLTSDTHIVNAIGATTRGYYPIGERMDESRILNYVSAVAEEARSGLTSCGMAHNRTAVPGLTVLGARGLNLLGDVLDSAYELFKKTAAVSLTATLMLAVWVIFLT